jgi:hypothetical protein
MKVSKESITQWNEYVKQALEAQENTENQMVKSAFRKHHSIN